MSRWLWLVKWLLLIPHYVVLVFLWVAFMVLTGLALVAIEVTGRYPRSVFEFDVSVLWWTWRVQYYAAGAFGTDRYALLPWLMIRRIQPASTSRTRSGFRAAWR